jgi:hypothetical protein
MGLYQDWVVPTLIDLSMRNKRPRPYRERVAGATEGRVLDVGMCGVRVVLMDIGHEAFPLPPDRFEPVRCRSGLVESQMR